MPVQAEFEIVGGLRLDVGIAALEADRREVRSAGVQLFGDGRALCARNVHAQVKVLTDVMQRARGHAHRCEAAIRIVLAGAAIAAARIGPRGLDTSAKLQAAPAVGPLLYRKEAQGVEFDRRYESFVANRLEILDGDLRSEGATPFAQWPVRRLAAELELAVPKPGSGHADVLEFDVLVVVDPGA